MRDREYAWVIQRNDGKYWACHTECKPIKIVMGVEL